MQLRPSTVYWYSISAAVLRDLLGEGAAK